MRLHFLLTALLTSALLGLSAQVPQEFSVVKSPAEVGFSPERLTRLDTFLQGFTNRGAAPSIVAFIARKGKVVFQKAYGWSSIEKKIPARTDDIYRIMSQSKLITTVGLLMLMEEGRFYLDQPISDFLPVFKNPKVLVSYDEKNPARYITRPAKSAITFRHLLSHTAGIPYEIALSSLPEFNFPTLCTLEPIKLETLVDKLAARPLIADPGQSFVYGHNTDIMGRLIEVLFGQTLDQYLRSKVCEPLGMTDSYFYLPKDKANRLVGLYSQETKGAPMQLHANPVFLNYPVAGAQQLYMGGSGMSGDIDDYARLCQMILNKGVFNGKRFLSPATIQTMASNQIGDNLVWDRNDKFGLGLQIFSNNSHYGDTATPGSLMWGGYFCSEYTIDPAKDLIMLLYTNVQPYAEGTDLLRKFRIMTYAAMND